MNRKEVLERYDVDKNGLIQDPGKFEGEMLFAPYFYDSSMESGADETIYDGDTPVDIFIIAEEDLKEFHELEGVYAITLSESDSGFVNLDYYYSDKELNDALEDLEEESEEEDER